MNDTPAMIRGGYILLAVALIGGGVWTGGREGALSGALLWVLILLAARRAAVRSAIRWVRQPQGVPAPRADGDLGELLEALDFRFRRQAEELLAQTQSAERFRLAAQALPEGVVILDNHRRIEWINEQAESSLGLDATRDRGMPVSHLIREPSFVAYLENGGPALELRTLRNPGHVLHVQLAPFAQGRSILLVRDITQLDKLGTMRRDFVANVSHELKTPLTVTLGFLETAEDALGTGTPEEVAGYLRVAVEQGQRMRQLIDDLLTLSSMETCAPPPDEIVPLDAVIAQVKADTLALSAGRHTVSVSAAAAPGVRGNARELHSALLNLATNAVRYTPDGGRIDIAWTDLADGGGEYAVTDTGIGIAEEHLGRLTERFYRVDRGRSRQMGGTGLGLAIVKHVLERHDATLRVTSTAGEGSRFGAVFPPARMVR